MVMKSVSEQKIREDYVPNSFDTAFVFRLESKGLLKQNVPCNFSKPGIKTISCFKLLPSIRFFSPLKLLLRSKQNRVLAWQGNG